MKFRGIAGICIFVIGIVIIIFSIDAIHQISEAKGLSQDVHDFFHHNPGWNPLITFFGGKAQERIDRADTRAIIALVSGIVLTILGAIIAIKTHRSKKDK